MKGISNFKAALKQSKQIKMFYNWLIVHFFKRNHIKKNGSGNKIIKNNTFIFNSRIVFNGHNNLILISSNCRVSDYQIFIQGNNNYIEIGTNCLLNKGVLWIEDNHNQIKIGSGTTVEPKTQFSCIEGCSIITGNDCMFSSDILVTTGDSHSITDLKGTRINPSKDIVIGNHVWVGHRVMIMKGTKIPSHSIVGAGSFVNKDFEIEHVVLAGNPAKVIKENIDWNRERI